MKFVLSISVLLCFSLHLSQAAVELNPGEGREERFGEEYQHDGSPQDAICTFETWHKTNRCLKDLLPLVFKGFPWAPTDITEIQKESQNQQQQGDNYKDPLDPINHVCEVFGDFLRCLDQHAIPIECLLNQASPFEVHTVFQFICHMQPRSTALLHSLQCLKESRVVDLLVFYLADRSGTHLNDMAQGNVNALFTFLNSTVTLKYYINPFSINILTSSGLICLPESVISQDIFFIVDRKCGLSGADLVRDYFLYFRTYFNTTLSKMGFPSNICDKETRGNTVTKIDRVNGIPDDTESDGIPGKSFDHFLEENSPGTAMDTAYGHYLKNGIQNIPDREFCNPLSGLRLTFQACVLLSYDPSGKARFNILQFAHSVEYPPFTPFVDSSSLKIFRSCRNLLQQNCGANATYFEYNYRVSTGSREIQKMMDNLTCEWQDMLIRLYIEASEQGNIWPTAMNAGHRPMFLSTGTYTFGSLTNSMPELLSVVCRGVKEISAKCGMASAKRIELFYHRVNYNWYTEVKLNYMDQEFHDQIPHRLFDNLFIT